LLAPSNNLVHILNTINTSIEEDVDMELEVEIKQYILHLVEKQDSIQVAQQEEIRGMSSSISTLSKVWKFR